MNVDSNVDKALTLATGMINSLGNCIGALGAIPCCIVCPNPYKPVVCIQKQSQK